MTAVKGMRSMGRLIDQGGRVTKAERDEENLDYHSIAS